MAKQIPAIEDEQRIIQSMQHFNVVMDGIELWERLTHKQYAKNTLVAFKNDWNAFLIYCHNIHATALPATPDTVRRYLELMAQTRKLASLKRYLVTIGLMHRCHAQIDPCLHTEVRLAMRQWRLEKHRDHQQAYGFHDHHLQKLLATFHLSDKIKDRRDMAIWSIMFEGMLKRSELSNLLIEDLYYDDQSQCHIMVKDSIISLSSLANSVLQPWLIEGDIQDGYVFRRIDRHGNVGENAMDHSSIYRVLRRASDTLGFQGKTLFSGQSPRVGAAKDLAEAGLSVPEIQHQGRWKSPAMPAQYVGNYEQSEQEKNKFKKHKHWEK